MQEQAGKFSLYIDRSISRWKTKFELKTYYQKNAWKEMIILHHTMKSPWYNLPIDMQIHGFRYDYIGHMRNS